MLQQEEREKETAHKEDLHFTEHLSQRTFQPGENGNCQRKDPADNGNSSLGKESKDGVFSFYL
jgi:hypothetical protein